MTHDRNRPSAPDSFSEVISLAQAIFACGGDSVHGPTHWFKVHGTAAALRGKTGADEAVVGCFAFLHDSCRHDDGEDPLHGVRAADRLPEFRAKVPFLANLAPAQMRLLEYAIRHHVDGLVSDDPTIGTCWDADRLDLGRVGIVPDEQYMSTAEGKRLAKG